MYILSTFTQIPLLLQIISIGLFTLAGIIVILQFLFKKRIDYIAIVVVGTLFIFELINVLSLIPFIYALMIITGIYMLYAYFMFIVEYYQDQEIKKAITNQIKGDTHDFYLCLDKKLKILDYSKSFTTITSLNKDEIKRANTFPTLFKALDVATINDEEGILSNIEVFLSHLNEATSKFRKYHFTLELKTTKEVEPIKYTGLIEPIYLKNYLVAYAMYLYKDKMQIVKDIKAQLLTYAISLRNNKSLLNYLMNMSEGVALYFDFEDKLYYATEAFIKYCDLNKRTYTFQEFYDAIKEEDKEQYNMQSELVNSVYVTRLKYQLKIKNVYYNAIEDSMYLTKDGCEFMSIVHLTGVVGEEPKENESILSTKESVDLLNKLVDKPVTPIVFRTEEILKKATSNDD